MAEDLDNDDKWLYGESNDALGAENENVPEQNGYTVKEPQALEELQQTQNVNDQTNVDQTDNASNQEQQSEDAQNTPPEDGEIEKQAGECSDKEDFDEDSDDDDVNVVIAYTTLNIKRGGLLTTANATDKTKQVQQPGKFAVEEFDQVGTINGVPATEYNLDSLEEKPWRKPGADITDYFNYGFNEDTWRAYCERQKRLRVNESGVGLAPMSAIGIPRGPVPIMNDNSKYSGNYTAQRGSAARIGTALGKMDTPKENVIQVMTADRREYSRKPPGFPDMSMPPPNFEEFQPEYGFNPEPEPFYGGYEPTQDSQWGTEANSNWTPQEIKPLTGPPMVPPVVPPVNLGPPMVPPVSMGGPPVKDGSPSHRESRDREREISRSRSEKPRDRDRDRERSHRRERSRSRSRRHKSRSRSPSHRSHRKKKSRRHDDSTEANSNWTPQEIKPLTGPPMVPPVVPPVNLGPPMVPPVSMGGPPVKDGSPSHRESRDREREISRSRSEKPRDRDRDRERSHRRERSRSRSRRHKSRSRSPSHRSHRKKKSRRHDDSD
ncbi:Fip1 motif [Popillia japonica]|uniref:Fip1 motif n=1 Tax=Popillia japonica TaxID=7064 RepID=A0AAW1L7S1_POPJA